MTQFSRLVKKAIPSALTFLSGAGALFIADIIISRSGNTDTIAQWATLRSFMIISGVFAICGMDQLLVREPKAASKILKVVVPQIIIVGIVASAVGKWLAFTNSWVIGGTVIIGFAFTTLAFHWLRSKLKMNRAYIANASWRILFLASLLVFFSSDYQSVDLLLASSFGFAALIVGVVLLGTKTGEKIVSIHDDVKSVRDVYGIGLTYFMASVSLAIASYGEALIVHQLGSTNDVAIYFKSAVVFLLPGVVFNQYLAAFMGPYIRQDEVKFLRLLRRYRLFICIAPLLILPTLLFVGRVLELLFYEQISTSWPLAILLSLIGCARAIYILPSSFVSVVANRIELKHTAFAYLVCALILPLLSYILIKMGVVVVLAVAAASLLNWTLRCSVGIRLIKKRYQINNVH